MNLLYKVAENKQNKNNKDKKVDPYVLATGGLGAGAAYHTGKAIEADSVSNVFNRLPDEVKDIYKNYWKNKDEKNKAIVDKVKESALAENNSSNTKSIMNVINKDDPIKLRNKHGLIAAGLATGILGTALYGKHQSNKEGSDKKYHMPISAGVPTLAASLGSLGLIGKGALEGLSGNNIKGNKYLGAGVGLSLAGMGMNSILSQRSKNNQYRGYKRGELAD